MEEIFKQYGGAIITSIAALTLIAILFTQPLLWGGTSSTDNNNVMSHFANNMDILPEAVDYDLQSDKMEFDVYAARTVPTLYVASHINERQLYYLSDLLTIIDNDGYKWDSSSKKFVSGANSQAGVVKVTSIIDSDGVTELLPSGIYDSSTQKIKFTHAGTYILKVTVKDYYNVTAEYTCTIPVDFVL